MHQPWYFHVGCWLNEYPMRRSKRNPMRLEIPLCPSLSACIVSYYRRKISLFDNDFYCFSQRHVNIRSWNAYRQHVWLFVPKHIYCKFRSDRMAGWGLSETQPIRCTFTCLFSVFCNIKPLYQWAWISGAGLARLVPGGFWHATAKVPRGGGRARLLSLVHTQAASAVTTSSHFP